MNQPTPTTGRRRMLIATAAGAVGAAAIASVLVGTMSANAAPAKTAHTAKTATTHPVLTTRHTSLGTVLVNGKGRTLYLFTPDTSKKSTCTGACATAWPPLTVKAGATVTVGGGARHAKITTIKRGSARQVVYAGHPLYTFSGDSAAGQTHGEGAEGRWYAVTSAGKAVRKTPAPASAAPASGSSAPASSAPSSSAPSSSVPVWG